MSNLPDLDKMLLQLPPGAKVTITANGLQSVAQREFLAAYSGVQLPADPRAFTARVDGARGVNLRWSPLVVPTNLYPPALDQGTVVDVLDGGVVFPGSGFDFWRVRVLDGRIGYAASQLLTKIAPATRKLFGVHVVQGALGQVESLVNAGVTLPSATVVNEPKIVDYLIAQGVRYVIVRNTPTEVPVTIPDDPVQAEQAGRDFVAQLTWTAAMDARAYAQVVNEVKWTPGHVGFWLGVMKGLEGQGRRAAICAYAVGQPEENEWLTLVPALRYAMGRHVVCLHAYCAPGTPIGQLSADGSDYELRPIRLYNAAPADARPDLIISEFAHEFTRGYFEGAGPLVATANLYQNALSPSDFVKGIDQFTVGTVGWGPSSIDSALVPFGDWIKSGRFP